VVATFADGHVTFLNETIDYLTFCLLMTPVGRQTRPAGSKSVDSAGQPVLFLNVSDGRRHFARSTLNEDDF
jgi:hypothetical protein